MDSFSYTYLKDSELLKLLLVLAGAAVAVFVVFRFIPSHSKKSEKKEEAVEYPHLPWFRPSIREERYTKRDAFWIVLLMVLYGIVSFWQLGTTVFPSTTWQPTSTPETIVFELTEGTHFDSIYSIYGEGDNNANLSSLQIGTHNIVIEGSNDLNTWAILETLSDGSLYQYHVESGDWDYRYIRLTSVNPNDTLTEIGFKAYGEEKLLPVSVYEDPGKDSAYPAELLIDEQDKVALDPDYRYESYFDEVYHPRNAWEIANREFMYATVHPLLGTSLIALSIHFLGMNPFAWRLPGVITGILLLPLFYVLVKNTFHERRSAVIGTLLLSVEFMHLTTSRIATLEPFSVFWILAMFLFMIRYYQTNFYDTPLTKTWKLLFLSGLCMGLGIATKWTACYSAIGLAILLFTNLIRRWYEYRQAAKASLSDRNQWSQEEKNLADHILQSWRRSFWKTIGICFVFFIFIPAVIYWVSYMWCPVWRDGWSIANVISQNSYMYHYHINLKATHPYQSYWYQWILDIRPIWYYGRLSRNDVYHSISCFTNPAISWFGFVCVPIVFYDAIRKRTPSAWIISIGYLTALLPWVLFVNRCVFSYHFYPTSFFMLMAIVYVIRSQLKKSRSSYAWVLLYLAVCIVLFFLFLPATAGFGAPQSYMKFLEWLPSWYFG